MKLGVLCGPFAYTARKTLTTQELRGRMFSPEFLNLRTTCGAVSGQLVFPANAQMPFHKHSFNDLLGKQTRSRISFCSDYSSLFTFVLTE